MSIRVLCVIYVDFTNWGELHMHQRWLRKKFWALFVTLALGTTGCAQLSERRLEREVEILKKNQEELRKEVAALKGQINKARPSGPNVRDTEFELGDNPVRGSDTASLTLVEFTDYQ
jgi:hypothetical protein